MIPFIELVEGYKKLYGNEPLIIASAPARLDFLNTHQDYKGLPVVSVGINLRTYVAIGYSENGVFRAYSNTLRQMDSFKADDLRLLGGKWFGDYVRAVLIALKKHGYDIPPLNIYIDSEVPIASGLGSSATLEVSILGAINDLLGFELTIKDIAEIAFEAENGIMKIPCGRLDQYASAYGGVLVINTRPPYNVEELEFRKGIFIVVDSGIKHSTADIHPKRQEEVDNGLKQLLELDLPIDIKMKLGDRYWLPHWSELREEELTSYLDKINPLSAKRILFTLRMHKSTLLALEIMKGEPLDPYVVASTLGLEYSSIVKSPDLEDYDLRILGLIMTYQHRLLDELYDVSLPELNRIVEKLVEKGAYGAKLSGAGLGGAIIGLTDRVERAHILLNAVQGIYAPRGWIVSIDKGLQVTRW